MKKYLNQWFDISDDEGNVTTAQCVDIEFETGFGPIFLMKSKFGNSFWLTRRELKEYGGA